MSRTHLRSPYVLVPVLALLLVGLALFLGDSKVSAAKPIERAGTKPTVVKELVDKRTENSETFLLSDGKVQAVIYAKPIHYKDASGAWQKVDTTLVPGENPGEFVSRATPVEVKITSGATPRVSLTYKKRSLTMALKEVNGSPLAPAADTATSPLSPTTDEPPGQTTTSTTAITPPTTLVPTSSTATQAQAGDTLFVGDTFELLAAATTDTPPGSAPATEEETTTTALPTTSTASSTTTSSTAEITTTSEGQTTTTAPFLEASESTATFAQIAPDASLSYEVMADGVKENITLASPSAPRSYTFTIEHAGLIFRKDDRGQWGFYDEWENPEPLLVMGAPVAWDSSRNSAEDPDFSPPPAMTVTPGKDESTVTFSLPESWLTDPARVYPVTLDPTVSSTATIDTFISSGTPNDYFYTSDRVSAGNFGSPNDWVTGLIQFDLPTDLNNGAWVQDAELYLRQFYQSTSSAQVARISAMTKKWIGSDTYNSLGSTSWFGSDTVSVPTTSSQAQDLTFPVESIVQKWADGTMPNYGFTLYQNQTDHSSRGWYRRVYSTNYSNSTYWPKLTITYVLPKNVETDYGANGTDTLNDTAALQNAIDALRTVGGTVYIPAGTYYIDDTLTISGNNVTLMGVGTGSVIRPFAEASDPSGVQAQLIKVGTAATTNITIKGLNLRLPRAGHALKITGSATISGVRITGNTFSGGADSVEKNAINVDATSFSDLNITDNDLSLVTSVPFGFDSQTGSRSIFRNTMPAKPYSTELIRGADAYDAAVRLSKLEYPNGAGTVVLMTGESYALAPSASVLAKAYDAPILLSHTGSLDTVTGEELKRLGPTELFVVGLSSTIATAASDLLTSVTIDNDTGANDNATAANIATSVKTKLGSVSKVVVVPSDYPIPGLAVAPGAAKQGWPVLLTPRDASSLPTETYDWYTANMSTPSAVEVGTTVPLTGISSPIVINGEDDYETADLVVDYEKDSWGSTFAYTGLASGALTDWQYSLASGAYLGKHSGIMLVTNGQTVGPAESSRLTDNAAGLDKLLYLNLPTPWQTEQTASPWLPPAPRHTTYDLGDFGEHSLEAELNTGSLGVSVTDLSIESFGPDASLTRAYSSTNTSAGYFATGWTFGFERELTFPITDQQTNYTDEYGDTYTFLSYTPPGGSGWWIAPNGYSGTLRKDGSNWTLKVPEGETLTFDSNGKLISEADLNGNTTSYTWGTNSITILAANGQQIQVTLDGGKITQALYSTGGQTRTVTYATASPWTVTYSYSGGTSTPSRSLTYAYTSNVLTGITAGAFAGGQNATEGFTYTSGKLSGVTYPDYDASSNPDARVEISNGAQTATVTAYGRIYATTAITGQTGTAVTQTFTWNPSGTMASKTNPKTASETTQTWTYTYAPYTNYLTRETSPLGTQKDRTYNNHGNLTSETDWHAAGAAGNTTTYTYPNTDPGIPRTLQVAVSWDLDDAYDASGDLRITGYSYVAVGRGTYVDKAGWVFRNITIPQGTGATITGAYVTFYAQDKSGSVSNLVSELGLAKVTQIWSWATVGQNPATLPITTSKIGNWRPTWTTNTWVTSPDLSAALQEVTNQAGWVSGNNLGVLWRDTGTAATNLVDVGSYSYGAPPVLTVYYQENPDPNRDNPKAVIDPLGHKTEYTYDAKGNLTKVRRQLNATEWAETRYTYEDETVGTATYKGALVEEKALVSGSPETGTWAVSDLDTDVFYTNGQPKKIVSRDVVLEQGQADVDLTVTQTYDGFGNLLTKTNTAGEVTETNTYDLASRLLTSTGPSFIATVGTPTSTQLVKHLNYDAWGHLTESWATSSGEAAQTKADWVTTSYDKAGRPSQVKRWLSGSPPPSGTPQSTQDLIYDGLGRLIQTTDSTVSGLPALTAYDAPGSVVASWLGGASTGSYDLAKASRNINADNTPAYDALGRLLRTANPGDDPTTYTYTDENRVLRETEPDGTWTEYTYDAVGNVTHTTTSKSSPSYLTTSAYDYAGRRTSHTDGNNLTTTFTYDLLGRQITAGAQGQSSSQFTYNTLGWQLKIQDADGFTTSRVFDQAGRLTSETSAAHTTTYTYQVLSGGQVGLLKHKTEAGGPTRWEQNDSHIVKTGTWSDYAKTEASGGSYGRSSTAGATATISFTGTRLDWIAMTGTTPGIVDVYLDNVFQTTVDLYSSPAQYQVMAWSTGMLPDGPHTVQLVRSNQSLSGEYIVLDAVDVWGSAERQATYTYDWFGRANTNLETAAGTTVKNASSTYDSLGRASSTSDSTRNLSHSFTYPQNTAGHTTDTYGIGSPGSDLVTTTLTVGADGLEASRATTITSSPQVPSVSRSITTRDNAKRVTKTTLQTDTSRYVYSQYAFDSAGRIQKQWGPDSGAGSGYLSTAPSTNAYTYDSVSGLKTADNLQLQSVGTAGAITSSYTYTPNGRLATASTGGNTETYTFDAAGNLTSFGTGTSLTYTENRLQTMTVGGATTYYFFDANKRWRTVQAPNNSQTDPNRTTFAYTGTGRLQTYTKYAGGSASLTGTYTYDAQGQRTKSVVAVSGGLTTTSDFVYQGLLLQSLSATQSGTGATSWKITYLYDEYGKPYAGIYRNPGTSTTPVIFAMVTTDRGDVVELLDAAGNPFAAYRYDAWGNPQGTGNVATGIWSQSTALITSQVATDIANRQPLRYASYYYDSESGLYYLSARSYDPVTRQFLSKDLSRNDGEQSAYQYCGGNPVGNVDPTGYRAITTEKEQTYRAPWFRMWLAWYSAYAQHRASYAKSIVKKAGFGAATRTGVRGNKKAVASADVDQRIGKMPPPPPGYDKKTWEVKKYRDGTRYLLDPEGQAWRPDPGDWRHWPHWHFGPEGGKKTQRYPPNSLRPRPGQGVPGPGESDNNPWPKDARDREWNWAVPYMLTPEEMPIIMPGPGPAAAEAAPVLVRFIWRAITAIF